MLLIGIKELHLTEEEFWRYTPRKFFTMMSCVTEYNNIRNGNKTEEPAPAGFIDQISGW